LANRSAVIETSKGTIGLNLFVDSAPITAGNFIELADKKFYDGLSFHRYVGNFVIQGGCPRGDGTGSAEKNIKLEIAPGLKHDKAGVLAMARSAHPDSASCQFYITLAPAGHLDGAYAIFGEVTSGLDAVMQLREGDKIQKITIEPAE
jgi:cyclophilin family peptidyl-prolyl cis-trans isomerase